MIKFYADNKSSAVGTGLHHTKCTFYHILEHRSFQVISQWMQACYAIKLLWVIVYFTTCTSNCFHTEMQHTLYALLTDTTTGTTQSMSSSAGKLIPILRGLNIYNIFSCIVRDMLE
jgi:hypothetical protein